MEQRCGCVTETNVAATRQCGGDQLPMRSHEAIWLLCGVCTCVSHLDQLARFDHPGQTVVGVSLATQRAGQPYVIVLSGQHNRRTE